MEKMIEFLGERTGNCLRVAVALEETGLSYSVTKVNLRLGEHLGGEYRALNPSGKVPTIIDHTTGSPPFVLTQSNAIILYLDQKAPAKLFPIDPIKRAIAIERFMYFITDVIGFGMASFRTRNSDGVSRALLGMALDAWMDAARFLTGSRYMAGDEFSAADIAAATFISAYQNHVDWSAIPELNRWFEDVASRPTFVRGMMAFDKAN